MIDTNTYFLQGGDMAASMRMMLAALFCVAGLTLAQAQEPVTKANMIKISATIQAIDQTTRTVTLRDEKGNEDTFTVGPAVQRFNELKVGQKVNITYYESIVFQLLKPGEKGGGASIDAALNRAKSALPAGTVAVQDKATVTVKAVDMAVPSITVDTADGRTVTRKIENKKNLEGVKVGDKIDITFTRALLTEIQNAK
jgi:Cu/Ag efflux protein CusF